MRHSWATVRVHAITAAFDAYCARALTTKPGTVTSWHVAPSARIIIGGAHLLVEHVDAVARTGARVELDGIAREKMKRSHTLLLDLVRREVPIYGLSTGCGPLATQAIAPDQREEFQRNLIRSHAVGLGAPLPAAFVRAAMTARAHVLARGYSGVDPAAAELLVGMLNEEIHPIVREVGSVGASGDLVELAQIALAMIGEGRVERRDVEIDAATALADARLTPLRLRHREGLAVMNGTSFHTGVAALLLARARRVAAAAEIAAAMLFDALRGNADALAAALHAGRPHRGQRAVAERVSAIVRGSALVRHDPAAAAYRQDAYTIRCIPQVLGPVFDTLDHVATTIETELDSVTDNPTFLPDSEQVIHGGNFHGQPVAMAIDQLKLAVVQLAIVAERRIARVLDPALNDGLPPFLVSETAGVHSGLMGMQYCASSMVADNAVLAAPASVRSVPTNANNQDVVSMGMVAARQGARVIDNAARVVAIELLCAAQALDLRGVVHAGEGTRAVHAVVRSRSPGLGADRPLADDVAAVCGLIESGAFASIGSSRQLPSSTSAVPR